MLDLDNWKTLKVLFQALTSYSTQENRSCTLPGKHSRVDPAHIGIGEPPLREWEGHDSNCLLHLWFGGGNISSPCSYHVQLMRDVTLPFTICNIQENGPCTLSRKLSWADPIEWEVRLNHPENVSMGNVALVLICQTAAWAWERCTSPLIYM